MDYSTFTVLSLLALLLPLGLAFGCQGGGADEESPAEDTADDPESKVSQSVALPSTNRLADETSLYLLLHAHNPVDWYPWGEEALSAAKAEGKLIFLSIGYSSCYWCHVMERESFMDQEVAAVLNEHFVCIKVDREERPDIDEIYMTSLQLYFQLIRSPQGGGWPLTMILTPDALPVMGGTYFPPRDMNGRMGLVKVLERVQEAWQRDRQTLQQNAELLAKLVKQQLQQQPTSTATALDWALTDEVLSALAAQFDPQHGGFGYSAVNPQVPKFPQPSNLVFLLNQAAADHKSQGDNLPSAGHGDAPPNGRAQSMLLATLEKMAAGGIRDHLGGGFHRYSTDRFWAVPHFEKMLYDNAQLASIYAEAYRLTRREDFRRIVEEILEFVIREMTGPDGGFYSAIDAETDGEEGRYYVWQRDELAAALTDQEFELLADVYGISQDGNFEGRHVLLLPRSLEQTAEARKTTEARLRQQLAPIREKLLRARNQRERPLTDTKVLTSWTGLMIRGFADAGRILENPRYTKAAQTAADFVLERLHTPEGRLRRTFAAEKARLNAYLDDYALLVDGLIALHRATGQRRWLEKADRLTAMQIDLFWDEQRGGFFFTSSDHEELIARSKDPTDSAIPSGNAVAAGNLVYLARELDKPEYLDRAENTLRVFAPLLKESPTSMPRMAVSLAGLLQAR